MPQELVTPDEVSNLPFLLPFHPRHQPPLNFFLRF